MSLLLRSSVMFSFRSAPSGHVSRAAEARWRAILLLLLWRDAATAAVAVGCKAPSYHSAP